MKDKKGIKLKAGDIMAEITGFGIRNGKRFSSVKLWEVPKIRDGRGIMYTVEGKKTNFYWVNASSAERLDLDKLPEGFVFAFKHGLDCIDIEDNLMIFDIHDAIKHSDYKERAITPEIVENMKAISKIKITSFTDIAQKWESIFCINNVPYQIVNQIMSIAKRVKAVPINGEIGMSAIQNELDFMSVYYTLKKWRDSGCLFDKCKDLDIKSNGLR